MPPLAGPKTVIPSPDDETAEKVTHAAFFSDAGLRLSASNEMNFSQNSWHDRAKYRPNNHAG